MMILNINRARPGLARSLLGYLTLCSAQTQWGTWLHWPAWCQGWQPPHTHDNIARADCVQPPPAYWDFLLCRASQFIVMQRADGCLISPTFTIHSQCLDNLSMVMVTNT